MKAVLALFLVVALGTTTYSQDIDIYSQKKNINYEFPYLNSQISFEEFQLLNRTLRLQDMAYAAIVPGYVHFKVKDPLMGWSMVAYRAVGYAGLTYVILDGSYSITDLLNGTPSSTSNVSDYNSQQDITYISIAIVLSSYMFDYIHGRHRLEKKQEMIRYKYGLKFNMSFAEPPIKEGNFIPTFGMRYSF
jgi:hypothetical protein